MTYAWRLLRVILIGQLPGGASISIFTLALADIGKDLDASAATLSWAVTGGILASAISGAVCGKLGDVHGHKRVYVIALGALSIASLLSGLAWNAASLIGFRSLAGVCVGASQSTSAAMIMRAFPSEERHRVVGWHQSAMTIFPAIGLLAGGPTIDAIGWRPVFFVFAALAVTGCVVSSGVIRPSERGAARRIDFTGALLLVAAIVGLLLYFERGKKFGFTDSVPIVCATFGVAAVAAFVAVEGRVAEPLIRLHYFTRRNFAVPTMLVAFLNYAFMGGLVVAPIMLRTQFHYSNTHASLLLFMRPALYSGTALFAGRAYEWLGERSVAIIGSAITVASMVAFALSAAEHSLALFILGLIGSGVGFGMVAPAMAATIVNVTDPADYGVVSGMRNTISQVGVTAGAQTMTVMIGAESVASGFRSSFLLGAGVASVGLVLSLLVRSSVVPKLRRRSAFDRAPAVT